MSDLFTGILFICNLKGIIYTFLYCSLMLCKLTHNLIRRRIAEPCILSLYIHPCRCIRRMLACDACILASASEAEPSQSVACPCERTLTHNERRRSAELYVQASGAILSHMAQSLGRVVRTSRARPEGGMGKGSELAPHVGASAVGGSWWGKAKPKPKLHHIIHTLLHTHI